MGGCRGGVSVPRHTTTVIPVSPRLFLKSDALCQVVWLWRIIWEMDEPSRAKLLRFVTGTSALPPVSHTRDLR